ncbi:unnamed protein product, partial [Linum tenue]
FQTRHSCYSLSCAPNVRLSSRHVALPSPSTIKPRSPSFPCSSLLPTKSAIKSDQKKKKTMSTEKPMEVVRNLDVPRYMGRWYEIASFPALFQPKKGENTRATYTLKEDGATVGVLNETWSDGKRSYIEGIAYKADPESDEAKLKVKFKVPPILPVFPVTGDYWVLYIDPDYQHALIGQPSRKYLWILSRTPHMEAEVYNELVQRAVDEGYDVSKLKKTPQADPAPEAEQGPEDKKGFWWIKSLFGR